MILAPLLKDRSSNFIQDMRVSISALFKVQVSGYKLQVTSCKHASYYISIQFVIRHFKFFINNGVPRLNRFQSYQRGMPAIACVRLARGGKGGCTRQATHLPLRAQTDASILHAKLCGP